MMRSGLRPSKTTPRPPFSPPIKRSSSSSTSSKNSVHCLSAPRTAIGISWRVNPGVSTSTIASEGSPSSPLGEPRARDHEHGVGVLDAGDERLLAVEQEAAAVAPQRGGEVVRVGARAGLGDREGDFRRPRPIPRSQRSFCTSVPWRVRMLPTIAGETTISSRAQPAAEISSPTHDRAVIPRPPPPYSSGMLTPR